MRTIRIAIGLVASVGALAVAAVPASAAEFVASGKNAPKLTGRAVGTQEFVFKAIHVTCQAANVRGTVASPQTLNLAVTYKECAAGKLSYGNQKKETLPMRLKEKANFTYHINGYVESGEEVEMKVKYLKCLVDWGTGTYPEKAEEEPNGIYTAATYTPETVEVEPGVQREKILISNDFKGMEWEEEGGACEEFEELFGGENGRATGNLQVEVPKGDLKIE